MADSNAVANENNNASNESPVIGILMGSASDWPAMQAASDMLDAFGVAHECNVLSAHRTPNEAGAYARSAEERGLQAIICGAGLAAHLAGVMAAYTTIPILGVPMDGGPLKGMDALLATVQMPGGIPVATFAIGKHGAKNAALFAVSMLANNSTELRAKLHDYRKTQAENVLAAELIK